MKRKTKLTSDQVVETVTWMIGRIDAVGAFLGADLTLPAEFDENNLSRNSKEYVVNVLKGTRGMAQGILDTPRPDPKEFAVMFPAVTMGLSVALTHLVVGPPEGDEVPEIVRALQSRTAEMAAKKRHAADPKQAAKLEVEDCWRLWQEKPTRYKGKAEFARDMLNKYSPPLTSAKVIEDWCREWEKRPK